MTTRREPPAVDFPGALRLRVLYGSHAHGTATDTSDEDWRGAYQLPTLDVLGLYPPRTTFERAPDQVFWEIGHFSRLLLKGNPNIVGMLWTPPDCVYETSSWWDALVEMREAFITRDMVRAYVGWVHTEIGRDPKRLTAKRLSHVPRLLWEIEGALRDRAIPVRLPPDKLAVVRAIKTGEMGHDEGVALAGQLLLDVEAMAEEARLPAPPVADVERILYNHRLLEL